MTMILASLILEPDYSPKILVCDNTDIHTHNFHVIITTSHLKYNPYTHKYTFSMYRDIKSPIRILFLPV